MRYTRVPGRRFLAAAGTGLALLLPLAFCLFPCAAQQVHRNSFETNTPSWVKGSADVAYDEQAHSMTDQGAHDGQRCESLRVSARQGSFIYYQYATARAPISDELSVGVWVKSNRPGVQLLARVVFPNERDPNSLDDRLTTLVRGEIYRGPPGRWRHLDLGRAVALVKQQQLMMQAQLRRPVNVTDAYIDALLLNVYGGPGVSEVWIDALEVGPVLEPAPGALTARPGGPPAAGTASRPGRRASQVEFNGAHLLVDNRRFFFRGIRWTDTPVKVLREAGFNTLLCDYNADPRLLRQAADLGFWLAPHLPVATDDARLTSADGLGGEVRRFAEPDNVLFWQLGNAVSYEQSQLVSRSAQFVRSADPQRPLGIDAWDGLARYSGNFNLLGVHRWPLMTTMDLVQYRNWLEQRRRLANPGTFLWTYVQTHTPEWHAGLLYERTSAQGFTEPIGPQPEQIRLLTYTALGVGCRGVAFWSDRFLADSHQGRDRLLTVALLNQEMEMLEPLLVDVDSAPVWLPTSAPDVQAAVLRTSKGVLVLPMWVGPNGQYVPGQAAYAKLSITVPQVPQCTQVWEVTPGEVRSLRATRVPGGTQVILPEFGLTSAVVFTSDLGLLVRFQELARDRRQLAAQWTYELAVQEMEKMVRVQEQLQQRDLTVADAAPLIKDARDRLRQAKAHWENGLYSDAYRESQRALRPVRILTRALWDKATLTLTTPVASPYALSYYTLPRHLQFMEQVKKATPAANALPGGSFELTPGIPQAAWAPQEMTLDDVDLIAERVSVLSYPTAKKKAPKTDKAPAKPAPGKPAPATAVRAVSADPLTGASVSPRPGGAGRGPTWSAKDDPELDPHVKDPAWRNAFPVDGKYCLKLEIRPKHRELPPPQALERTFLAINSPAVHLPPGSLVQVSAWILVPATLTATADGAMFYDSAGGEPLAVRVVAGQAWKKYTLYRRVPASGTINVTLALTGLGWAYFDDVRIEPLVWTPGAPRLDTAPQGLTPVPQVRGQPGSGAVQALPASGTPR